MNIIICTSCDGEGEKRVYDDYRDWDMVKCKKCDGTGRLWTRTYSYEVSFNFDKNKIYKTDDKIIKLIRELEKNA